MGLDQYLHRKVYVGNQYKKPENQIKIIVPEGNNTEMFPVGEIDSSKISEITLSVGYWRKANAIHRWYVENVQDGEDDCGGYYVSKEQLKELHDLCLKAKDVYENGNKEDLKDLLPSQSGFFFGSTAYDEWYLEDLKTTISILEPIIKLEKDNGDYYYTSSW